MENSIVSIILSSFYLTIQSFAISFAYAAAISAVPSILMYLLISRKIVKIKKIQRALSIILGCFYIFILFGVNFVSGDNRQIITVMVPTLIFSISLVISAVVDFIRMELGSRI